MRHQTGDTKRAVDGPAPRLLRLWLWSTPLVMLAMAVLFGVLAAGDENWGIVAAMVALAVAALALFFAQWLLLRPPPLDERRE